MRLSKNVFSPRASRVIRVLLVHANKGWTIEELSKEAQVSIGFTHAVVMSLVHQGHAYRDQTFHIKVSDPVKLVQRWAAYHSYMAVNIFRQYHTFEENIENLFARMKGVRRLKYALTVLAGAHIVAPYVRPTTLHFYVEDNKQIDTWVSLLGLRPVETGGNVSVVLPFDAGVFYGTQNVRGMKVVSTVQLYVDLFNYPARGEEAAQMVLRSLEKEWRHQTTYR